MNWSNIPNLQCSDSSYGFTQVAAGGWHPGVHGLMNSLNPIDHPWNFDSATVAKHRLRSVIRADRKACGDGKWVYRSRPDILDLGFAAGVRELWGGPPVLYRGKPISLQAWASLIKPRYRWEWRR